MTVRALALLVSAMVLAAITILLGIFVLGSLFDMFRDSLRYGRIIGGGMADGFPFVLAVVVFILAKWTREIWMEGLYARRERVTFGSGRREILKKHEASARLGPIEVERIPQE